MSRRAGNKRVWKRFARHRLAIAGLVVIVVMTILAVAVPLVSPFTFDGQDLDMAHTPPVLTLYDTGTDTVLFVQKDLNLYTVTRSGRLIDRVEPQRVDLEARTQVFQAQGRTYTMDFSPENRERFGTPIRLMLNGEPVTNTFRRLNLRHPLGTDSLGRDVLVRVMFGARISLFIALMASLISFLIGATYGGVSGYFGGRVDDVMMRLVDIISSIPFIIYVILIMIATGGGLTAIILAMGITYWINMARIVRGQSLSLQRAEFVQAARAMGFGHGRIVFRHILPNAIGPIIVTMAMMIPSAIFTEAFLSFIGLGLPAPQASWGTLINDALGGVRSYGYLLLAPSIAISLTMLAFNFIGDGLRDALDPRFKS